MNKIKIALIDDHDLFREGMKLVLNQIEDFEVIFDTSDGNRLFDFLQKSVPDVILMDIEMPKIDGVETTTKALKINKELKVIALSMFSDLGNYTQMINAGVKGFVIKNANKFELKQAISTVYNGANYFSQEIISKLAFQKTYTAPTNKLTKRELEILNLVCKGHTSQEVADEVFISKKTVEVHRTNIFQKAQVRNIAELIIWAIKNNYFQVS